MGLELNYSNGQTPLDEDEKDSLLIKTISTRSDLDEFEQLNIEEAKVWLLRSNNTLNKILSESFIKELHNRMFNKVWRWAGTYRNTNKNIGVDKFEIPIYVKNLIDDAKYWIDKNIFSKDEIAVRFSHRIVSIHPFPNGNGRHSRLIADVLISKGLGNTSFTWGSANLSDQSKVRADYLSCLRSADEGDITKLLKFART